MKKIFTFVLALSFNSIFSQNSKLFLTANVFIGYAFECGYVYGVETSLGVFQINALPNSLFFSLFSKFYFVNQKNNVDRIISSGLGLQNNNFAVNLSMAEITRRSGYNKINRFRCYGPQFDIAFHPYNHYFTPIVGSFAYVPLIKNDWYEKTAVQAFYFYFPNNRLYLN